MQVQVDRLQQPPVQVQQPYGGQFPWWPQPLLPHVPVMTPTRRGAGVQAPKKSKLRVGRLGKRERAEMKAACGSSCKNPRAPEGRNEGSEEEPEEVHSGDSWLLAGRQCQGRNDSHRDSEGMQQCVEMLGKMMQDELGDLRCALLEKQRAAIDDVKACVGEGTQSMAREVECLRLSMQDLKLEMSKLRELSSEIQPQLLQAGALQQDTVVQASDTIVAECRQTAAAGVASVKELILSHTAQIKHAISEQSQTIEEGELEVAQRGVIDELKVHVEIEILKILREVESLRTSMTDTEAAIRELHESKKEAHQQSPQVSDRLAQLQEDTIPVRPASSELTELTSVTRNVPAQSCLSVDTFDRECSGSNISLFDSDTGATGSSGEYGDYASCTAYGKMEVSTGKHLWELEIVNAPSEVVDSIYVGVAESRSLSTQWKYCSVFLGNIIYIALDISTGQLSITRNEREDVWSGFGSSHIAPGGTYRLAVCLFSNASVKIKSYKTLA